MECEAQSVQREGIKRYLKPGSSSQNNNRVARIETAVAAAEGMVCDGRRSKGMEKRLTG